jgi:hypothetical protein
MTSATTSPDNHKLHETSSVVNHKYMTANRKIKQSAYVRPQRQAASGIEVKKLAVYLHTLQKHMQFRQLLTSRRVIPRSNVQGSGNNEADAHQGTHKRIKKYELRTDQYGHCCRSESLYLTVQNPMRPGRRLAITVYLTR